jgi:hypothetical protein
MTSGVAPGRPLKYGVTRIAVRDGEPDGSSADFGHQISRSKKIGASAADVSGNGVTGARLA